MNGLLILWGRDISGAEFPIVRLEHLLSWKELKRNDYWRTFTMRDYLPADCMDCGMKLDCEDGCREAAYIIGGGVDSPDPLLRETV